MIFWQVSENNCRRSRSFYLYLINSANVEFAESKEVLGFNNSAQEIYHNMLSTTQKIHNDFMQSFSPNDCPEDDGSAIRPDQSVHPNDFAVDQKDYWTEEDKTDILSFSWKYATSSFPEDKAV
jgi:hypothetical protein